MTILPAELISGIAKIDELTLLIHSNSTQKEVIPFLSELRDERLTKYNPYSNYYSQYADRLFDAEKRGDMPTFNEKEVLNLNYKFDLVLVEWQHITYKDKMFNLTYIKNKETGELFFRDLDQFSIRDVYDKKTFKWVSDSSRKMCCNDHEYTTMLVWQLHEISVGRYCYNQCKPAHFFNDVKKDIKNLNAYYGYQKQPDLLLQILNK